MLKEQRALNIYSKESNEPMSHQWLTAALSKPLGEAIPVLCECTFLEELVERNPQWEEAFFRKVINALDDAFEGDHPQALGEIHRALFSLYELHVTDGTSARAVNQFNPTLTRLRSRIERAWLAREERRARASGAALSSTAIVPTLKDLWARHPVSSHPLFDFLEKDASREQIVAFFKSDSALNIRFFDLLLYSMIGSREGVRRELAQNLWDEAGRGEAARAHVSLFQHLLEVVGVGRAPDHHASELGWEGLAGHNLFMLACVNRQHYFKLLGVMAMTELLDPSQYEKLARGCRRVGLGGANELEYYDEHVTIDVIHGEGWLSNVIEPILRDTPEVGADILLGAVLRMATCKDYYDALYARLNGMRR
jgi:Iron-containing redox enzyme